MLLAFTWSLQNQMWNRHWVVINLETRPLGIPKSSLLELNNNFVSRIPSSSDSQKFLRSVLIPYRQSPKVSFMAFYKFFHIEVTFQFIDQPYSTTPSPISSVFPPHWTARSFHVSAQLSLRLDSSHFAANLHAHPHVREASGSSTPKSGFQFCCLGKPPLPLLPTSRQG